MGKTHNKEPISDDSRENVIPILSLLALEKGIKEPPLEAGSDPG